MKTEKEIQEIIENGTPRKKALFVCKKNTEAHYMHKEPSLSNEGVQEIVDSLKPEEYKTYNKWIRIYNTYLDINEFLGTFYKEYQVMAERLLCFLNMWEDYEQEENHLNLVYQELKDKGLDEAATIYKEALTKLSFAYADLTIDEERDYIKIDIAPLYKMITDWVEVMKPPFASAKAVVIAVEEFIVRTSSRSFIPELTRLAIEDIKGDYVCRISPKYSKKRLQEKIDKGLRVTEAERKRAVFPYYEEIEEDKQDLEEFRDRIEYLLKRGGRK